MLNRKVFVFIALIGCTFGLSHASLDRYGLSKRTLSTTAERKIQVEEDGDDPAYDHAHDFDAADDSHHDHSVTDDHAFDHDDEHADEHDDEPADHDGGKRVQSELSELRNGDEKPWSEVIVASILINLTSLIGLVFVACGFKSQKKGFLASNLLTHIIIPSFACGALLATCVFLIIPESIALFTAYAEENLVSGDGHDHHRALQEDDHDDHADDTDVPVAWRFGASILGGFLLPLLSSLIFPHASEEDITGESDVQAEEVTRLKTEGVSPPLPSMKEEELFDADGEPVLEKKDQLVSSQSSEGEPMTMDEGCEDAGCGGGEHHCCDEESPKSDEVQVKVDDKPLEIIEPINYSLAACILLGDFFHNFTDGVFVGTAFSLCHRELAITIAAATVYHELAQEIADYLLLTKHCNLSTVKAIVLNFIGGLSILFGALLVLAFDISANATGGILAMGGGVYIYIAGVECWPRVREAQKSTRDKCISVVGFFCGVIPIGLVLLNHGHCDA